MKTVTVTIKGGTVEEITASFPFGYTVVDHDLKDEGGQENADEEFSAIVKGTERYHVISHTTLTELLCDVANDAIQAGWEGSKKINKQALDVYVMAKINTLNV